jgi:aerotaxis receptor
MTKKLQTGTIQNAEIPFDIAELFFSRTNLKGILAAGNDVFVRVSAWSRSDLQGRPHNVIRHPDMPRTIFHLFWEKLKAGTPIVAYVKNLAADGRYYWVIAAAFPIANGYMSIRLKPTSPLLAKVRDLYAAILREEKESGFEGGRALLMREIVALGYVSYEDFMTKALVLEMHERTVSLMGNANHHVITGAFARVSQILSEVGESYAKSFAQLSTFQECGRRIADCTDRIIEACTKLDFVCYNMTVSAARLGGAGACLGGTAAALAVISDNFRQTAETMQAAISQVGDVTRQLASAIADSEFDIASAGLQINMLDFYVRELATLNKDGDGEDPEDVTESCRHMITLLNSYTEATSKRMQDLAAAGTRFKQVIKKVRAGLMALDMIKETGKMEVSRVNDASVDELNEHIRKMAIFVSETEERTHTIEETVAEITAGAAHTVLSLQNSAPHVREAAQLIDRLIRGKGAAKKQMSNDPASLKQKMEGNATLRLASV